MELLASDTIPCPANLGATAEELTELFERTTGEQFTDTPGLPVTNRVRSMAKVMGNLTRAGTGQPLLQAGRRRCLVCWSRAPRQGADVALWRRRCEDAEQFSTRPVRRQMEMAEADAGLAMWIQTHPYLTPAEIDAGESGMALLLLWEVDHQCPWPSQAVTEDRSNILTGFTRRLKRRVADDPTLSAWLRLEDAQRPLVPGLADTHHGRWTLRVRPPPTEEPQGWWDEFTRRWKAFLATQQHHLPPPPAPSPSPPPSDQGADPAPVVSRAAAPRRSRSMTGQSSARKRPRPPHPELLADASPSVLPQSTEPTPPPCIRTPRRPLSPSAPAPARKKQATLLAWVASSSTSVAGAPAPRASPTAQLDPPPQRSPAHGRAAEGPPT